MENEEAPPEPLPAAAPVAPAPVRRRRLLPLVFLIAAVAFATYLGSRAPHEQHVRFSLGAGAADVTSVEVQYLSPDGEIARGTQMKFEPGRAPRIIPHDPSLPDGPYRLRIEIDTRNGRRSAERQVTLGGGTTSVDLARVIERTEP